MSGALQPLKAALRRQQRLWQLRGLEGAATPADDPSAPVTVYGLFGSSAGLGEAARLLASGLEALGRAVARVDCTPHLSPGRAVEGRGFDTDPGVGPLVIHLNPVEAAEVMVALAPPNLAGRRRIGVWLYELAQAPDAWRRYGRLFHDIWSPSETSRQSIAALGLDPACVPYRHLPLATPDRQADPVTPFRALVMADYHSSLARKDVKGALDAFDRAFGPDHQAELWLKLSNVPPAHPLLRRAQADPRIQLLTDTLDLEATLVLIAQADVLLSLHRAEGYGLTLVEALLLGTPVVMSDEPTTRGLQIEGCVERVGGRSVAVDDPQDLYPSGTWFQADTARAAEALQRAYSGWADGSAQAGRKARSQRAAARLCAPDRLEPLRRALAPTPASNRKGGPEGPPVNTVQTAPR